MAPEDAGQRLDRWLAAQLDGVSRSQVARAVAEGRVRVDGGPPAKVGVKLRGGEAVAFEPLEAAPLELVAQDLPVSFLHRDERLVVVDKAAGVVVHPAAGHPDGTLVNGLLHHLGELEGGDAGRPGIVHRLDRDTTGALVVARDAATHAALAEQFRAHTNHRRYVAVVLGTRLPEVGHAETRYGRHPTNRLKFTARVRDGKRACTRWQVVARSTAMCLVVLELETGRTHQIRVHLSERGYPVVADRLYGREAPKGGGGRLAVEMAAARHMPRQALHAASLGFTHPATGERLLCSAPLPNDLATLVDKVFGAEAAAEAMALAADQSPMPAA